MTKVVVVANYVVGVKVFRVDGVDMNRLKKAFLNIC